MEVGQKVWLYPANEKHGGSIRECTVTHMEPPWFLYLDGKRQCSLRKSQMYSTLESAQKQKSQDKADHPWRRRGVFGVSCVATVVSYLSFVTGIDKNNIQAHKTESGWLHVSWADGNGLHKEKLRIGGLYNLKEEKLHPLIFKMARTAGDECG